MKNVSFLMALLGVAAVIAITVFLLDKESGYSPFTPPGAKGASGTVAEIRKTEVALQHIERLRITGDFTLNRSDDLLSAHEAQHETQKRLGEARITLAGNEMVFPVHRDEVISRAERTDVSRLIEMLPGKTTQQNHVASGYAAPVTTSRSPDRLTSERTPTKETAVDNAVHDVHQVSFIYISPTIRRAIVNGVFVHEGEVLGDGSRVTAINDGSVIITRNKKQYSLNVPKPLSVYSETGEN